MRHGAIAQCQDTDRHTRKRPHRHLSRQLVRKRRAHRPRPKRNVERVTESGCQCRSESGWYIAFVGEDAFAYTPALSHAQRPSHSPTTLNAQLSGGKRALAWSRRIHLVVKGEVFHPLGPEERAGVGLADEAVDGDVRAQSRVRDTPIAKRIEKGFGELEQAAVEECDDASCSARVDDGTARSGGCGAGGGEEGGRGVWGVA